MPRQKAFCALSLGAGHEGLARTAKGQAQRPGVQGGRGVTGPSRAEVGRGRVPQPGRQGLSWPGWATGGGLQEARRKGSPLCPDSPPATEQGYSPRPKHLFWPMSKDPAQSLQVGAGPRRPQHTGHSLQPASPRQANEGSSVPCKALAGQSRGCHPRPTPTHRPTLARIPIRSPSCLPAACSSGSGPRAIPEGQGHDEALPGARTTAQPTSASRNASKGFILEATTPTQLQLVVTCDRQTLLSCLGAWPVGHGPGSPGGRGGRDPVPLSWPFPN